MKKYFILLLFISSVGQLFSQQVQFKVLNRLSQQPIAAVNIYKGAEWITVSNKEGQFIVNLDSISENYILKAIGYQNLSVQLSSTSGERVFYLSTLVEALSEVQIRSANIPTGLQNISSSISVIRAAEFRRTDATNILESLNNVPGIYINQGALNTNKINIRGIGARSQYSTNRIQAYYDGIPLSTAEGELTLDDFDQEAVERVEIIKGPTSSVYGAGLGGSINLYSKTSIKAETSAKLSSQFGSYNTQKHVLQASNSTENSSIFATFSSLESDGYRENGNYNRKSALVNGAISTSDKGKLSYIANFTQLKAFIPSSLNKNDYLNNPESASFTWKQAQGFESYDRGLLGGSYTHSLSDNFTNTTSIFISFRDAYEPRPFDILKEESVSAGIRTKFNLAIQFFKLPSEISFGAQYYNEWYETGTFKNLYKDFPGQGSVLGDRLSNNEQDRNYSNFFAQINLELSEKWSLEVGANLNTTKYSRNDLFSSDQINQSGNYSFETIFSPRIGSSYEIVRGKNIFASISQGFSTPTVSETLTPDGQINTSLKPEIGTNFEVGFKGNWLDNNLYTELTVYSIQIDNLLVAQRIAEDQYIGMNAGKTNHNGIEFLTNYNFQLSKSILVKPYLNAAFNFFEFDQFINDDKDFSGNKLPGVPKYTMNVGVDLKTFNGFEFFANFRNAGELPLNDANSEFTDSYNLLNFKASYSFKIYKSFELNLYGGVNNALDEHYAASIVTNAVGFGSQAPRYYYPGNPRNYYGGLQLSSGF